MADGGENYLSACASIQKPRLTPNSFGVILLIVIVFYILYKCELEPCEVGELKRDTPASEVILCVHDGIQALRIPIAFVHLHASSGHDSQRAQHTL